MTSPKLAVPLAALACACASITPPEGGAHPVHEGIPGRCEEPVQPGIEREGCYFNVAVPAGPLNGSAYWHIDEFADRTTAEAARMLGSAIVETYGRVFLQTVNDRPDWRSVGGRRLATVGPMPVRAGIPLTARYMEARSKPGAATFAHQHPGPEGFYVVEGSICLETPEGVHSTKAGEGSWVRGDIPMALSTTGTGIRRSLVLVVHPAGQAWISRNVPWRPTGRCLVA